MISKNESISIQIPPCHAALALQRDFARFAGRMRSCDLSLQDDLIQEMSLGVLQCTEPHTLSFFRSRALSRARDFLKIWQRKQPSPSAKSIDPACISAPWAIERERGAEWYLEKINALMEIQPGSARALIAANPDE